MTANIKGVLVNMVELLIVLFCGIVLIMTTMNGQPSETIIGIFGGYLGVAYKNAQNKTTTTTTTTTTKNHPNVIHGENCLYNTPTPSINEGSEKIEEGRYCTAKNTPPTVTTVTKKDYFHHD